MHNHWPILRKPDFKSGTPFPASTIVAIGARAFHHHESAVVTTIHFLKVRKLLKQRNFLAHTNREKSNEREAPTDLVWTFSADYSVTTNISKWCRSSPMAWNGNSQGSPVLLTRSNLVSAFTITFCPCTCARLGSIQGTAYVVDFPVIVIN